KDAVPLRIGVGEAKLLVEYFEVALDCRGIEGVDDGDRLPGAIGRHGNGVGGVTAVAAAAAAVRLANRLGEGDLVKPVCASDLLRRQPRDVAEEPPSLQWLQGLDP